MISLDLKNDVVKSSPINLSIETDEPTLSFSDLLKGIKLPKDVKGLVLAFDNKKILPQELDVKLKIDSKTDKLSKTDTLTSLLKKDTTDDTLQTKEEPVELNPKLTLTLSTKEIKTLVSDAKEYLKSKILQSDGYRQAEIKELPKTVKGLAALAKKLDIDVSKITVEDVQVQDTKLKTQPKLPELKTVSLNTKTDEIKTPTVKIQELKLALKTEVKVETKTPEAKSKLEVEVEVEDKVPEIKTIKNKPQVHVETKSVEVKSQVQVETKSVEVKPQVQVETKTMDVKTAEVKPQVQVETKTMDVKTTEVKPQVQVETKTIKTKTMDAKTTPLFKAQTTIEPTTTEQIVQTKINIQAPIIQKTAKEKADETLKLLLRGEKPINNNTALTADFSVTTAKVIAPSAKTDAQNSFESLLKLDTSDDTDSVTLSKNDVQNTTEADDFNLKLKEAKQMIKYLSTDVKTAIEDYKSPFTRVKVQLNPKNLGEIDLTVVQRGKNLHINLSSNNTAINTLNMNINELKTQLSNTGINNATFNFNSGSQNGESAQQQQQNHQQNQKQASEEYKYFTNEETHEEVLNSLEIIVPQYG